MEGLCGTGATGKENVEGKKYSSINFGSSEKKHPMVLKQGTFEEHNRTQTLMEGKLQEKEH